MRGRLVRCWLFTFRTNAEEAEWQFFADKNVAPEICYEVEPIEYQWSRAEIYPL